VTLQQQSALHSCINALVLVPTRVLCEQVKEHFQELMQYNHNVISILDIASDISSNQDTKLLQLPDILIATPGRLVDNIKQNKIKIDSNLEILVIDEADLVLSYGYESDIQQILQYLPKIYQCFLMSATLGTEIDNLKRLVLHSPVTLKLEENIIAGEEFLKQHTIRCTDQDKFLLAFALLKLKLIEGKTMFFVNSIDRCYKLKLFLESFSIRTAVLNYELPHNSRYHIIQEFNKGIFDYLIATDNTVESDDESEDEDNSVEKQENADGDNSKEDAPDGDSGDDGRGGGNMGGGSGGTGGGTGGGSGEKDGKDDKGNKGGKGDKGGKGGKGGKGDTGGKGDKGGKKAMSGIPEYSESDSGSPDGGDKKTKKPKEKSLEKSKGKNEDDGLPPDSDEDGLPPDSDDDGLPPDSNNAGLPPDSNNDGLPPDSNNDGLPPDSDNDGLPADSDNDGLPADSDEDGLPLDSEDEKTKKPKEKSLEKPKGKNEDDGLPPDSDEDGLPPDSDEDGLPPDSDEDGLPLDSEDEKTKKT